MILVDVNVLLYAYHPRAPQHEACRSWLLVLAFIRLSTSPRVFGVPLTTSEAVVVVSGWLSRPQVVMLDPGERHWDILQSVLNDGQASGPLVTDAEIAALALEHGAAVCTTDRDFKRFTGLRVIDPLAA